MEVLDDFFTLWCNKQFGEAIHLLLTENFSFYKNADSLKERWQRNIDLSNISRLSSGGSSGDRTIYTFGPFEGLFEIEHLIKKTRRPSIRLTGGSCNSIISDHSALCTEGYEFDYNNTRFDAIENFSGNLFSTPNLLLFLSKEQSFIDLLARGRIESIISTDWEPFFDESVFAPYTIVNDNMCSWKNGHFFKTCGRNKKHALPFSINDGDKSANLLNLASKNFYYNDDVLELVDERCGCGLQWPVVKKFENHTKNTFRPKMNLRNKLEGQYLNLQFIRNMKGEVELFAKTKDNEMPDIDLFQETFNHKVTHTHCRCPIGIKYPNFWSFDKSFEREQFLPVIKMF